jgi:hypothetical protein
MYEQSGYRTNDSGSSYPEGRYQSDQEKRMGTIN